MGQCSTLPVDTRSTTTTSKTSTSTRKSFEKQRSRREKAEFSRTSESMRGAKSARYAPFGNESAQSDQIREPNNSIISMNAEGIEVDVEQRDSTCKNKAHVYIPLPPEIAERVRCYKLNLDADFSAISPTQKQNIYMGPFAEAPPELTYTSSEDSTPFDSLQVAIQTAQIFRGITVSRDGVILTQNARAMRNNQGKKNKKGEKSRQATKIEESSDLVEETIVTGKAPDSDAPARLESIYVMGEYDDMKYLVRDGSRKIRDAEGLPDTVLINANELRIMPKEEEQSPERRASHPLTSHSHVNKAFQSVDKSMLTPPRLKSHPRDTRSSRRFDCRQEDNWGLLWSCGVPQPPSSPNEVRDQRAQHRESGATARF